MNDVGFCLFFALNTWIKNAFTLEKKKKKVAKSYKMSALVHFEMARNVSGDELSSAGLYVHSRLTQSRAAL